MAEGDARARCCFSRVSILTERSGEMASKQGLKGSIKSLKDKGFGFISVQGEAKDVFFHMSALIEEDFASLQVGDSVTFDLEHGDKGPKAVNVRVG